MPLITTIPMPWVATFTRTSDGAKHTLRMAEPAIPRLCEGPHAHPEPKGTFILSYEFNTLNDWTEAYCTECTLSILNHHTSQPVTFNHNP